MYSFTWVETWTPGIFRYAFHSASILLGGANRGAFRGAPADWLIERAEATESLDEQDGYYRMLQE